MKLLDQLKTEIRRRNYSYKTEVAYASWVKQYVKFHDLTHPAELNKNHITEFLNHLADDRNVSASTQNQALCALIFLYQQILNQPVGELDALKRAKKPNNLPVVLSVKEVQSIIEQMQGTKQLIVKLLYGSGMRISEALRLRVQDIDFDYSQIAVRTGKGGHNRFTILPESLIVPLQQHLKKVKNLHQNDLKAGYGEVVLPNALRMKYAGAASEFRWQYVFPSSSMQPDPRSGNISAIIFHHQLYRRKLSGR